MVRGLERRERACQSNAVFQIDNRRPDATGITFAALRHVKTKLNWGFAFAFGLLASLALPPGAAEAIVSAVAWVEDLHIAEFAVAANALTIVP
jgi:hypothetical protein